jgi:hypothetical protein
MSTATHGIAELARSGLAQVSRLSTERICSGLAFQIHELFLELCFFASFLLCFATFILGVEGVSGAPFCVESVFFDLEAEEEHHVVPVRFVRVGFVEMGKQFGVSQFLYPCC